MRKIWKAAQTKLAVEQAKYLIHHGMTNKDLGEKNVWIWKTGYQPTAVTTD